MTRRAAVAVALAAACTIQAGAPTPGAVPAPTSSCCRPPTPGPVTALFDPPEVPWARGHRGVDLAAAVGDTIRSPADGVVTYAGAVAGRGVVTVRHTDGLRSSVEPVEPSVRVGDVVGAGAVLGTLQSRPGHRGVHWGVRVGTRYLDPLDLLPGRAVVLLPVDAA
ncbi:M23 family metallopeptidase [Isoptericola sp. b441]|uniref:M23 family metallopeptidase n=1 Tax=Actinotalea lenta TaxID=3064654 RepID=A0ABT9D8W9_9CELL|nr:M23 family metallopeptidase [Isoptericola sp. b441]MDO8107339.1 M23 family metallopeptidase [Isoptericola sp. b441]